MQIKLIEISFINGQKFTAWFERFSTEHTVDEILKYSGKQVAEEVCNKHSLYFGGYLHYLNSKQIQSIVLLEVKEIPDE